MQPEYRQVDLLQATGGGYCFCEKEAENPLIERGFF